MRVPSGIGYRKDLTFSRRGPITADAADRGGWPTISSR